jgi:transketolase
MALSAATSARPSISDLQAFAREVRLEVLKMTHRAGSGHPGGSMSEAELLTALYYGGVLRVDPKDPKNPDRDRFILSKGHCCPGLYAVLGHLGFFPREEFQHFRRVGHLLQGHTDIKIPGVDMSAGSLGMGLSFANGCALAARIDKRAHHTWVMLGDGECQEGNIWEAAMTSAHRKIDNMTAILDYNKIQIDGFVKDVKGLEPVADKWRAFGWHVIEIDGHSFAEIFSALDEARETKGKPTIIIAHTIKGKGVSFMENKAEYHGRALNDKEMAEAMRELGEAWS